MTNRFLAFDLGAESGRAILGQLSAGVLTSARSTGSPTSRCARTARCTGTCSGSGSRCSGASIASAGPALDSIGVDTWGCDYALLGEHGNLLENPFTTATRAPTA